MKGTTTAVCEPQTAQHAASPRYILKLFIAGTTIRSQRAVVNILKICREFVQNDCELQIIDIFQQPLLAKAERIFAVPMLMIQAPSPTRMIIGDLSEVNRILAGLGCQFVKRGFRQ